jgi:hypothetical protein
MFIIYLFIYLRRSDLGENVHKFHDQKRPEWEDRKQKRETLAAINRDELAWPRFGRGAVLAA